MSIFLENNTSSINKKEIDINEIDETINKKINQINEAIIISEIGFNNIMIETIQEEYNSILKEDEQLEKENAKNFFNKIVEKLKELLNTININLKNLIPKLLEKFNFIANYAKNNEDKIKNFNGNEKIKINGWRNKKIPSIDDITNSLKINLENSDIKNEEESFKKTKNELLNNEKIEVDLKSVKDIALNNSKNSTRVMNKIKKNLNDVSLKAKEANSEASRGASNNDPSKIQEIKEEVIKKKDKATIGLRCNFTLISILGKCLSDSHKVCKACCKDKKSEEEKSNN